PQPDGAAAPAPAAANARGAESQPGALLDARTGLPRRRQARRAGARAARRTNRHDARAARGAPGEAGVPAARRARLGASRDVPLAGRDARGGTYGEDLVSVRLPRAWARRGPGGDLGN